MGNSYMTFQQAQVSVFKNCKTNQPTESVSLEDLFQWIATDAYKEEIIEYRQQTKTNPQRAQYMKSNELPAFTSAGVFPARNKEGLLIPSNVAIIDIDDIESKERRDDLKASIGKDKYCLAVWISPGGYGLKVMVKVYFGKAADTYSRRYSEVASYFASTYEIPIRQKGKKTTWGIDASCCDLPRLCIISHDPEIIINWDSEVFNEMKNVSRTEAKIRAICNSIEKGQIDITATYDNWFRAACALNHELGEAGRDYFHAISKVYPRYDFDETEQQYTSVVNSDGGGITIATLFDLAKDVFTGHPRVIKESVFAEDETDAEVEIKLAPFPVDVFPFKISNFINAIAQSVNCPIDFVGVAVLAALSIAVAKKFVVEAKKGFQQRPIFYFAIIGDPGSGKSPALKAALNPIMNIQKLFYEQFKAERARLQQLKDSGDNEVEAELRRLTEKRIWVNDITIEKLADLLEKNKVGLMLFIDELAAWLYSFNQYKKSGNDRQKWLPLWSGESIIVDRKAEASKHIYDPFVTIIGGIQPDVLINIDKRHNDGLLDRLLFCFPPSNVATYSDVEVDEITQMIYETLMTELILNEFEDFFGEDKASHVIRLAKDAYNEWANWIREHEQEVEVDGFPYYLRGAWFKIRGHSLRLILILWYACDRQTTEISRTIVLQGIKLTEYFKTHLRKAFNEMFSDAIDRNIEDVLNYINKHGGKATARSVYRSHKGKCRNVKQAKHLFKEMEVRGLGKMTETSGPQGGRTTIYFELAKQIER